MNPTNYKKILPKRLAKNRIELTPGLERLFKASVIAVCGWALIEMPLELGGPIDSSWLVALVASKVFICLIGIAAIANLRFSRHVFAFICAAGVFAVAPALPLEYARNVAIALFSTVECLAKAACVAAFAIASLASDSAG
jgi:hypothetical protein